MAATVKMLQTDLDGDIVDDDIPQNSDDEEEDPHAHDEYHGQGDCDLCNCRCPYNGLLCAFCDGLKHDYLDIRDWCGCRCCMVERMDEHEHLKEFSWEMPGVLHYSNEQSYLKLSKVNDPRKVQYDSSSAKELQSFVRERGLPDPFPGGLTLKYFYIRALEKADEEEIFRFMDLPKELRLRVYEYLFYVPEDMCICHLYTFPQILRTCKMIYDEAVDFLYNETTIRISFHAEADEDQPRSLVERCARVHRQTTQTARRYPGLAYECLDRGMSAYPDFLRRIRKIHLFVTLRPHDGSVQECDEGYTFLRNCLHTLASFLMDGHALKKLEITFDAFLWDDGSIMAQTLYPLRRLRKIPNIELSGHLTGLPEYLTKALKEDMWSSKPTFNTLKHWQLIMKEAEHYEALEATLNPYVEEMDGPAYYGLGFQRGDKISRHRAELEHLFEESTYGEIEFLACEKDEIKVQKRLAKLRKYLRTVKADDLEDRLRRLREAQQATKKYITGSGEERWTIGHLERARSPTPVYTEY